MSLYQVFKLCNVAITHLAAAGLHKTLNVSASSILDSVLCDISRRYINRRCHVVQNNVEG
jgi:hypothetical protein